MARVNGYATGGVAPELVFYAPVVAVKKLAEKLGRKANEWDLIEANEAFAAQAIVDGRNGSYQQAVQKTADVRARVKQLQERRAALERGLAPVVPGRGRDPEAGDEAPHRHRRLAPDLL